MTRIAIVGSRDYPDLQAVTAYVDGLPSDTVVVSGGAAGVDITAENAAKARGLQTLIFRVNWRPNGKKYDPNAGKARNTVIVAHCDVLVAFWNGSSPGTRDSINKAKLAGKSVKIIYPEDGV